MTSKTNLRPLIAILAASAVGCGVQPETPESWSEAVNPVSTAVDPVAQVASDSKPLESFHHQPPHPDRVDPFSFPIDRPETDQPGTTMTTVAQIRVLGFAHVDEPRVLLRSKQTTRSLKVGEATDGVEVLAIKPPAVDLRVGSLVWTATMFDSTTAVQD